MNVFDLRDRLVADYASYTRSFIKIAKPDIRSRVESALAAGDFWPEPLLQLNPTFLAGGTIDELVADGTLHPECSKIFRIDKSDTDHTGNRLLLHTHQREAILQAKTNKSYVLTSGTGSGKSLTYIVPIVDHVLRNGSPTQRTNAPNALSLGPWAWTTAAPLPRSWRYVLLSSWRATTISSQKHESS